MLKKGKYKRKTQRRENRVNPMQIPEAAVTTTARDHLHQRQRMANVSGSKDEDFPPLASTSTSSGTSTPSVTTRPRPSSSRVSTPVAVSTPTVPTPQASYIAPHSDSDNSDNEMEHESSVASIHSNRSTPTPPQTGGVIDPMVLALLRKDNPNVDIARMLELQQSSLSSYSQPVPTPVPKHDPHRPGPSGTSTTSVLPPPSMEVQQEYAPECPICSEDLSKVQSTMIAACMHQFCVQCLTGHVESEIKSGQPQPRCPENCDQLMLDEEVIDLLGPEKAGIFQGRLVEQADSKNMVYCQNPKCREATFIEDEASIESIKQQPFRCGRCKNVSCLKCSLFPYHNEQTCEEYKRSQLSAGDRQALEEEESQAFIEKMKHQGTFIHCPNQTCPALIEKNDGCNHMKCKKCKYDFCYVCLNAWSQHPHAYFSCPLMKCPLCHRTARRIAGYKGRCEGQGDWGNKLHAPHEFCVKDKVTWGSGCCKHYDVKI